MCPKLVRGKVVEIGPAQQQDLDWIFSTLADPAAHVPLGLSSPPTRDQFDAGVLEFMRSGTGSTESVRYHLVRRRSDNLRLGFFLDFGWDNPTDATRELDLVIPAVGQRSLAAYVDATITVSLYMFRNRLAKRLRWRIDGKQGMPPRRGIRQGGRLLWEQREQHPVTGAWLTKYVYEHTRAEFEALMKRGGVDPETDYAQVEASVFDHLGHEAPSD